MKQIPDESVNMVLCDLPYGTTACKWDIVIPFSELWGQYRRLCKGAIVLTATQPFASALVLSNVKQFKHEWIWHKSRAANFANAKTSPLRKHESVLVFSNGMINYMPIMEVGDEYKERKQRRKADGIYGDTGAGLESPEGWQTEARSVRYPATVRQIPSMRQQDLIHPTQKPVALMEYLIRTYTNPGDTVLDNCMGSGTTGVACVNTGRNFIGIEKDATYFEIAKNRIERAQNEQSISGPSSDSSTEADDGCTAEYSAEYAANEDALYG